MEKSNRIRKNPELIMIVLISFVFCVLNLYLNAIDNPIFYFVCKETYIEKNILVYIVLYAISLIICFLIFKILHFDFLHKTVFTDIFFFISCFIALMCVTPLNFNCSRVDEALSKITPSLYCPNYLALEYTRNLTDNEFLANSNNLNFKNITLNLLLMRPGEIFAVSSAIFVYKYKNVIEYAGLFLIYFILYALCKDINMMFLFFVFMVFYLILNRNSLNERIKISVLIQTIASIVLLIVNPLKIRFNPLYSDGKNGYLIDHRLVSLFGEKKSFTDYFTKTSSSKPIIKHIFGINIDTFTQYVTEYNELSFALKTTGIVLVILIILLFIIFIICLIKSLIKRLEAYKISRDICDLIACILNIHLLTITLFGFFFDLTDFCVIEPVPFFGYPSLNYLFYALEIGYIFKNARLNTKIQCKLD